MIRLGGHGVPPALGSRRRSGLVLAALLVLSGCAPSAPEPGWRAVRIPTDADFVGAWFADSLNGWITGGGWAIRGGIVGRTRDGGRSWMFDSDVVSGREPGFGLGHVQFRDTLHGCVVGRDGVVMLTEDGGRLWRPAEQTGAHGGALFDVQFVDAQRGWAAGPGVLIRTGDGGETWRKPLAGDVSRGLTASGLHFVDPYRGWIAGHGADMRRTEDAGDTWTRVELPLAAGSRPVLRDVTFVGDRHGWVVGERGVIFHTSDGGGTWAQQVVGVPIERVPPRGEERPREVLPELETPPDPLTLFAVGFANAQRGWAVGYYADVAESVVLGTSDGGVTWTVEHVQPGELLRALFVLDAHHAWAAGDRARTQPQVVLRLSADGR